MYEKQCKYVNEPQCMTNLREKCENHPVKSCRDVDKFEDVVSRIVEYLDYLVE